MTASLRSPAGSLGKAMCRQLVLIAAAAAVVGCEPLSDAAHNPVSLPAPYNGLPADEPIQSGKPVILTARQQEAVVAGVTKWMKDPTSVQFGDIRSVQTPRGQLAVCGQVSGRNSGGRDVGLAPRMNTGAAAVPCATSVCGLVCAWS